MNAIFDREALDTNCSGADERYLLFAHEIQSIVNGGIDWLEFVMWLQWAHGGRTRSGRYAQGARSRASDSGNARNADHFCGAGGERRWCLKATKVSRWSRVDRGSVIGHIGPLCIAYVGDWSSRNEWKKIFRLAWHLANFIC